MDSSWYVLSLILINVALWIALSLIPRFKYRDKVFIVLSFVSLWIFLSIREPYSDMIGYTHYFQSIDTSNFGAVLENRWEVLFKVLLFGIRLITDDPQAMLSIVAFITLMGPFLFFKRYSRNYLLSIVMFIALGSFYMEFYIVRQAIALSVFLIVFHFISEKKLLKYCLGIIIAALFHKTALILLIMYPLVNVPPSKYKNIAIAVISILVIIFSTQITGALMSDFYSEYIDKVTFGNGVSLFLLYVFMYIVYALVRRKLKTTEEDAVIKASWLSIFLQFFAIQNNAFCRLANYTRDSFCVLIPNSIQKLRSKDRMLFSIIIVIACVCFVMGVGLIKGYNIL